jgi:hypothetical protein
MRKKHIKHKKFVSSMYWNNCIDSIIDAIEQDKETIINMLTFGSLGKAQIVMNLDADKAPSYQLRIDKIAEKSPFGEDEDE